MTTSDPRASENIMQAQRLLGRCLISQDAALATVQALRPVDLVDSEHRAVLRAMAACAASGRVSPVTVRRQLEKQGDRVELTAYIDAACLPQEVEPILALLHEHGMRRRVRELGLRLARLAEEAADVEALQQETAQAMQDAARAMEEVESATVTMGEALADVVAEATSPEVRRYKRWAFGFARTLGHELGGLASGLLYIVAARTSVGKTALAIQMATEAVRLGGSNSVLYVTLEMPPDQLAARIVRQETGITPRFSADGSLLSEINDDLLRLQQYPIRFNRRAGLTAPQIVTLARAVALQHGLDLVVVDYLQRIWLTGKHDSLARAIGEQVAHLQDMARNLEVPVVLVSQLNRDVERRDNKRPTLADLRDSGNIEEFADVVLAIYRHGYYERQLRPDDPLATMAEVLILKNRTGPSNITVPLRWNPAHVRFEEPTREEVDAYERALASRRAA